MMAAGCALGDEQNSSFGIIDISLAREQRVSSALMRGNYSK